MPAASCSFSQTSAASRLARSSSAPSSRHAGQSFSGSASHAGFGRLPAMVVSSIAPPVYGSPAAASILRAARAGSKPQIDLWIDEAIPSKSWKKRRPSAGGVPNTMSALIRPVNEITACRFGH